MNKSLITHGSGMGGGGGGGGEVRQPVEDPNTLQARMTARVLDIIAEGPCYGLANGLQSVYFDDTPLQNADGSFNFAGVEVFERKGTPDQDWISGFPAVEQEVSVGVKVKAGQTFAVTRRVTNENATAVRVTIVVAALFEQDPKTGDTHGSAVDFTIRVRSINAGAQWINFPQRIDGKTMGAYPRSYRLPLDGEGPWDVQVVRTTPDSDRATLGNEFSWSSYTEITDYKLTYSRSALIGTIYNAEQTSNVPRRTYDFKGWLCRVPTNFDGTNRIWLSDFWDGSYKIEWTDDPAWLFLQLLTHDSGAEMADSQIDKWTLYEISRYASERVPDGYGGFEPRFSANFIINTRQEAYAVINALASCFRAMTYWESGAVQVVADMPREPDIQLSDSNTLGGFSYNSPDFNSVHNAVLVSFLDKDNNYEPSVETVEDPEGIAQNGYNETEITAFACTSRGQAHRLGRWLLESEKSGAEGVAYKASLEHLNAGPGMIAEISDRDYANVRIGGRIINATTANIVLDEPFVIEPGVSYRLRVTLPDGTLATSNVTRAPGTYTDLSLSPPLRAAPGQHAQWAMLASNLEPRQFKIMGVTESSPLEFDVAALIHDPSKFARVEQGINISRPPTTRLPNPGVISPPGEITVSREYVSNGATFVDSLQVSWEPSTDPYVRGYVLSYRKNNGGWSARPEVPGTVDTLYGEGPGQYTFYVQAVNFMGVMSRPAVLELNILNESPITLLKPSGLQLDGQGNNTIFNGRSPKFSWRATAIRGAYPMGQEPAAGAGYLDHIFRDFEIRVTDPAGNVVFVDHTTLTTYIFDFEKNFSTAGGPHRAFRFTVLMRDIWGNLSRPADLDVSNPAPALPLALSARPGFEVIFISFERPTDPDFEGTLIWMSAESGFTPSAANLVYDGPDTFKSIRAPALTKQYLRLAGYDSFGKVGLNITPEMEVLVSGVEEVDFIPPAIPTGLRLSTSSSTAPDGTKRYKLRAEWEPNTEKDFGGYGVGIYEPGSASPVIYTTDEPAYEWDVEAGRTYIVQLRAFDKNRNLSLFSEESQITVGGDTEAPDAPTGLKAVGALRNILLSWDQHPAPDFQYMEIWESKTNDRAQAVPLVGAFGTSYSRTIPEDEFEDDPPPPPAGTAPKPETEPLPSLTRYYWIRAADRSRNKSEFHPADPKGGISATTGKLKVVDFGENAVIKAFMIDVNQIVSDHIESLNANKIQAGTTLSGSITVDNKYSLGVALDAAGNPVKAINEGTTTIDPGKIRIAGATTLASWKAGGDSTEINGGMVSANSIRAESLSIGNRQVEFVGIHFDPNKDANVVTWTAGHVIWQGEGGSVMSESIRAGGVQWAPPNPQSTIMYLCWTPGLGYINFTYDPIVFNQPSYIVIGQYYGGNGLVMHYGRTKIDGDYVRTNTISAAHIMAHQINADHLTVSGVVISSEIQVGFGAITDFHFGNGKIDQARIIELDVSKLKSGSLGARRIQVGGEFGKDRGTIVIEGRFGYHALRYHDTNGITRVEIGQNAPTPDPGRDGVIIRDMNGKTLLHANGFGVQIADENQLRGGSTANVHYFPGTPDFGFWSAPSTQGIPNRTLWTLRHIPRGANNEIMTGSLWRIVINGNPVFQWIDSEGFPPNNVIDIPSGAWITVNLQAYVPFLDGSYSWQPYNVKIGNDPYWSVHQYAKTYWTILELKR